MLRISQISETGVDEAVHQTAAGGGEGATAPTVECRNEAPNDTSDFADLGANHAATVLPWITEELRFHSVLDMGSGDGSAVRSLQDAGYEAHGIDLAPIGDPTPNIRTGDFFNVDMENGYFDLVMCCNNLHLIENQRISQLFGEIDRLSNSYIMITTPSIESGDPSAREVTWWCDRIQDLGWRFRLLRQDPETGQLVLLCEKPNSLASQILPLIDAAENEGRNIVDTVADEEPEGGNFNDAIELTESILTYFRNGDAENGFQNISTLADMLLGSGQSLNAINPIFSRVVTALEQQDRNSLVEILENELIPALRAF